MIFFTTSGFLNRRIASSDPKIGIAMTAHFEMTFFATLGFLNRRIASPDPKIGIAMTGSFRNDFLCDFGIAGLLLPIQKSGSQ